MNILLTGVHGFIGNYLFSILKDKHNVIGVSRSKINGNKHSIIFSDLSTELAFDFSADVIIHAAASGYGTVDRLIHDNVIAMQNIVKYACKLKVKKFIFLSSISVYGNINQKIVDEATQIVNPTMYGITKYIGETLLQEYSEHFPSISLRLPGVLGKGARARGPWVARVTDKLKRGEEVIIYNETSPFNNMVHLSELGDFILKLVDKKLTKAEILTLGCKDAITIGSTVNFIKEYLNSSAPIVCSRANHQSYIISNEKACSYGYIPVSAEKILKLYCEEVL